MSTPKVNLVLVFFTLLFCSFDFYFTDYIKITKRTLKILFLISDKDLLGQNIEVFTYDKDEENVEIFIENSINEWIGEKQYYEFKDMYSLK